MQNLLVYSSLLFLVLVLKGLCYTAESPKNTAPVCPVRDTGREEKKYTFNPDDIAFSDDSGFEKMPKPKEGDWLARFPEKGQTFEQYDKTNPNRHSKERYIIYLQPLGEFDKQQRELLLEKVQKFSAIFFQTEVVITGTLPLPTKYFRERKEPYKQWIQYHTISLLDKTLKPILPKDAFCYAGITMADLYPEESWNFVFGQASLKERVGVYSLARYSPSFYGGKEKPEDRIQVLRRACKVLSHEVCHMYGMEHCIFYKCDVSGSNSLEEMDSRPLHLCPICLKKLSWNIGFDIIEREKGFLDFYKNNKLDEEYNWTLKRIESISKK